MSSLKGKLLALRVPVETITLPELGGDVVHVYGLSGVERDAFESSMTVQRGKKRETNLANIRARFVVLVARDADGRRIFDDADVQQVGNLPASVLDRIFDLGRKLSGMTEADVEELGKGLESAPPASSLSASPEN